MSEAKHGGEWISVKDRRPEPGVPVLTKIDDSNGVRNEAPLKWVLTSRGGLWFFTDGSMYVYYNPTHWKPLPAEGRE